LRAEHDGGCDRISSLRMLTKTDASKREDLLYADIEAFISSNAKKTHSAGPASLRSSRRVYERMPSYWLSLPAGWCILAVIGPCPRAFLEPVW